MIDFIKNNREFSIYSALVVLIILIALFAPYLTPYNVFDSDMTKSFLNPSSEHWLGTDKLGRDTFSRLIYATQTSLFMTLILVLLTVTLGTIVGITAGFFRGKIEIILMRITDIMLSFPGIILAIAIAGIMGASIVNTIFALLVVSWAKYARLVRSAVIKICNNDYITVAELSGATTYKILYKHILPNVLPLIVVTAAMDIGTMMMEIAGLSFLGFGAPPPTPEWGLMLNEARQYMLISPELMIYPGAAIFIVVTIFNLWGDALRDYMDPRSNEKG